MVSFTSAPAFSSARTTPIWPSRTANSKGVNPESKRARKSAPAWINASTTVHVSFRRRPHDGGLPARLSFAWIVGAAGQQRFHGSTLPVRAAVIKSRFASGKGCVRVGPRLEQQLDHRSVSIGAGQ